MTKTNDLTAGLQQMTATRIENGRHATDGVHHQFPGWRAVLFVSVLAFVANQLLELAVLNVLHSETVLLCAWDCGWYRSIVVDGYDLVPAHHDKGDAANWAFFPLFPVVARIVSFLTGASAELSLVLTGKFFFFFAIAAFVTFCASYRRDIPLYVGATVAAFQPYALYGNTGYTESLFLLCTCLSIVLMLQRRYIGAGLAGGFASAVRSVSISLCLVYAVLFVRDVFTNRVDRERIVLGALLLPLGLAFYMLYLYIWTGDALAFSHIQRAWNREIQNPVVVLQYSWDTNAITIAYYASLVLAVVTIVYHAWRGRLELAVFSLACTLIPLSTGILSITRYIWWQAPVLLGVVELAGATLRIMGTGWFRPALARGFFAIILVGLAALQVFMLVSWLNNEFYMI